MKIIQVNKFYFAEYGTEKYWFGLMELLRSHGHTVIPFSMEDSRNVPAKNSGDFVSRVDMHRVQLNWSGIKKIARMIYSLEAKHKFAALLDREQPDLVHVHSIHHQISPSILGEAKKRGIPVVQTLHDYKLVCPSYHFPFREGAVCLQCRRGNWLHFVRHRGHKDSLAASIAVALESWVHSITKIYERNVDQFIVPSDDMAQHLIEFGVDPKKVTVVPHFLSLEEWTATPKRGDGVLFAGRLAAERGLEHLLKAAVALPEQKFLVAGDGPERAALEAKIAFQEIKNIELLGRVDGPRLHQAFRDSRVVFFPTLTLETFGLTVLEAMAAGKPVVATRMGAVSNLVVDGTTGYLYESDTPEQGIEELRAILSNDSLAIKMGAAGQNYAKKYSPDNHYAQIQKIFTRLLAIKQRTVTEQLFVPAREGATS